MISSKVQLLSPFHRRLAKVSRINKWQNQDWNPGRLALESKFFIIALHSLPMFFCCSNNWLLLFRLSFQQGGLHLFPPHCFIVYYLLGAWELLWWWPQGVGGCGVANYSTKTKGYSRKRTTEISPPLILPFYPTTPLLKHQIPVYFYLRKKQRVTLFSPSTIFLPTWLSAPPCPTFCSLGTRLS